MVEPEAVELKAVELKVLEPEEVVEAEATEADAAEADAAEPAGSITSQGQFDKTFTGDIGVIRPSDSRSIFKYFCMIFYFIEQSFRNE